MKKRAREKVGDLIKVPFKKGVHTYARRLIEGSLAFYDCISKAERKDFHSIIISDILFVAHVDIFAVKEGHWTVVANIPLENTLSSFYPRYFNPAPTRQESINFYEVYKSEIEEAIEKDWVRTGKMQLDGIHGREHIESRISDHYEGKRNEGNKVNIWMFKKYFSLTTLSYENIK